MKKINKFKVQLLSERYMITVTIQITNCIIKINYFKQIVDLSCLLLATEKRVSGKYCEK